MPANIRIYIEGDKKLLPGFRQFLDSIYHKGKSIDLSACGANSIADLMSGIRRYPDSTHVLLIDSEGPLAANPYQGVRQHDHWDDQVGGNITDYHLNFMVQVMESWFLADRDALKAYYGQGFRKAHCPPIQT